MILMALMTIFIIMGSTLRCAFTFFFFFSSSSVVLLIGVPFLFEYRAHNFQLFRVKLGAATSPNVAAC